MCGRRGRRRRRCLVCIRQRKQVHDQYVVSKPSGEVQGAKAGCFQRSRAGEATCIWLAPKACQGEVAAARKQASQGSLSPATSTSTASSAHELARRPLVEPWHCLGRSLVRKMSRHANRAGAWATSSSKLATPSIPCRQAQHTIAIAHALSCTKSCHSCSCCPNSIANLCLPHCYAHGSC